MYFRRFMEFTALPIVWAEYMKKHRIRDWLARVFIAFFALALAVVDIGGIIMHVKYGQELIFFPWILFNVVFLGMGASCYLGGKESLWRTACRGTNGIFNGIYAGYIVGIDKKTVFLSVYQSLPDWLQGKPLTMDNYASYISNNDMMPDLSILPVAKSLLSKLTFGMGDMVYLIARKKEIKRVYKIQDPRIYIYHKRVFMKELCFKGQCIILPEHIPEEEPSGGRGRG